jgi:hypothetical protein
MQVEEILTLHYADGLYELKGTTPTGILMDFSFGGRNSFECKSYCTFGIYL